MNKIKRLSCIHRYWNNSVQYFIVSQKSEYVVSQVHTHMYIPILINNDLNLSIILLENLSEVNVSFPSNRTPSILCFRFIAGTFDTVPISRLLTRKLGCTETMLNTTRICHNEYHIPLRYVTIRYYIASEYSRIVYVCV